MDCIEWRGCKNAYGYGVKKFGGRKGKVVGLHRVAYEWAHGKIPPGLSVLHRCDNRACVNPDHLFLGTRADNMRDAIFKGRAPQLSDRKVDLDRVRDLLRLGNSRIEIARWLGVWPSSIYRAVPLAAGG